LHLVLLLVSNLLLLARGQFGSALLSLLELAVLACRFYGAVKRHRTLLKFASLPFKLSDPPRHTHVHVYLILSHTAFSLPPSLFLYRNPPTTCFLSF
jgi:hypothetical protein